jgi:hypothetical protein
VKSLVLIDEICVPVDVRRRDGNGGALGDAHADAGDGRQHGEIVALLV